jgi:Fe-S cluster assembly scaffold protein SufB
MTTKEQANATRDAINEIYDGIGISSKEKVIASLVAAKLAVLALEMVVDIGRDVLSDQRRVMLVTNAALTATLKSNSDFADMVGAKAI